MSEYVNTQLRRFHLSPLANLDIDADDVRHLMKILQSKARLLGKGHFFLSDDDAYSIALFSLGALLRSKENGNVGVKVDLLLGSFSYPHNLFTFESKENIRPTVRFLFECFFRKYQDWLYNKGGFDTVPEEPDDASDDASNGVKSLAELSDKSLDPREILEIKQANEAFDECLRKLPSRLRQIVTLKRTGIIQTKIKDILELSDSTISVLLKSAISSLRSCLNAKNICLTDLEPLWRISDSDVV